MQWDIKFDPYALTGICIFMFLYNLLIHMLYKYILPITDTSLFKGVLLSVRKKVTEQ